MEKIKVLEILDTYYPKFDGPVNVVTNYCKSFLKNDEVIGSAIVPKFPGFVDDQPFEVVRVKSVKSADGYYAGMPQFDKNLKKYLRNNEVDLIHFHSPFTMGNYFAKYGKKHNIPTVFTFHTKFEEDFERILKFRPLVVFMMKYIMSVINKADYVLTVSEGAKDTLRSYGYKKEIGVIRNGTDLVFPPNSEELINAVNEKYGFDKDESVFLSVGRIVESKRIDFALDALKIVREAGFKFKFLIVGDGEYKASLEKRVQNEGMTDCVIFTGKIMDRQWLSAHYLRSDLFIFPSTFDTASLAPLEAAAMKLPTIMIKGCSSSEIISDNENGYLEEDLPEKWAQRIIGILKDPASLSRVKELCYSQVYRTWDDVSLEVTAKYKELTKAKS